MTVEPAVDTLHLELDALRRIGRAHRRLRSRRVAAQRARLKRRLRAAGLFIPSDITIGWMAAALNLVMRRRQTP